jgi:hypothetical protein
MPAAREIAARESPAKAFSRLVRTNAISRIPSWNASEPGLTGFCHAAGPGGGPSPADGDE